MVATVPAKLLEGRYYAGMGGQAGRSYDIAPDGQRFLMLKDGAGGTETAPPPSFVVVQNWFGEPTRLLPTK